MNDTCRCGKIKYDKKSAVTLKNKTMELHHISMRIYQCRISNCWHLASVGKHHKFRQSRR